MAGANVILAADFTCPFSYVTEVGLRRVVGPGVAVRYLAFELYPAPAPLPDAAEQPERLEALGPLAAAVGVQISRPSFVPRTRKAHEASRIGAEHGLETELRDAIYAAYWADGHDIGRVDTLVELGRAVGLDPDTLRIRLDIDAAAAAVVSDRVLAEGARITQTPTLFVQAGGETIFRVGAQSLRELQALGLDAPPRS